MKHFIIWPALMVFISACSTDPDPIHFGKDQCHYCKMTIADPKFGSELVTNKGRVFKFDAVECMVPYMREQDAKYAHILAVPFDDPGSLQSAEKMHYVISDSIRSPMGANLLVFTSSEKAKSFATRQEPYDWKGIGEYLLNEDF